MRSKRGAIGVSWLAVSVRERLEQALGPRGRAQGKRAARRGALQYLDVHVGRVEGSVSDGARPDDYYPVITIGPWHADDVAALSALVRERPGFALALFDGSFGDDHERDLEGRSLGILPGTNAYPSFDCSCSAWPDVCEHVYALTYGFVERIDEAPGDYLRALGIDVEDLDLTGPSPGTADDSGGSARLAVSVGSGTTGPRSDGAAGGNGGASGDEAGLPDFSPQASSRFHPDKLDTTLLQAMMSDDAASVFAAFYSERAPGRAHDDLRSDPSAKGTAQP